MLVNIAFSWVQNHYIKCIFEKSAASENLRRLYEDAQSIAEYRDVTKNNPEIKIQSLEVPIERQKSDQYQVSNMHSKHCKTKLKSYSKLGKDPQI
jgi:hypothetical protein